VIDFSEYVAGCRRRVDGPAGLPAESVHGRSGEPDAARLARDRGLSGAAKVHTAQTRSSWVTLPIAVIVGLVTAVGAVVGFQADSIVDGVTSGLIALALLGHAA